MFISDDLHYIDPVWSLIPYYSSYTSSLSTVVSIRALLCSMEILVSLFWAKGLVGVHHCKFFGIKNKYSCKNNHKFGSFVESFCVLHCVGTCSFQSSHNYPWLFLICLVGWKKFWSFFQCIFEQIILFM